MFYLCSSIVLKCKTKLALQPLFISYGSITAEALASYEMLKAAKKKK